MYIELAAKYLEEEKTKPKQLCFEFQTDSTLK